jgi:putative transposase
MEQEVEELEKLIVTTNCIWNYALMLQKKSYEWTGKIVPCRKLYSYISKKRWRNPYWQKLTAQTVQEIIERLDKSYQKFFKKIQKRPPKFRSIYKDTSFVFKQSGYSIDNDRLIINKIGTFRFIKHRAYPMDKIRRVSVRKYNNRFYIIICCDCEPLKLARDCDGTAGIDFGLKTFITLDNGEEIASPRFLFRNVKKLRKVQQALSRKEYGSNRRKKAKAVYANLHAKVAQQREDWHWKLAHALCKQYSVIKIEDLCLEGWKRLWGRKAYDLAIGSFILKLQHVAIKYGTEIVKIDRFYASSHICSACGHKLDRKLGLKEREWQCPVCGVAHKRDVNAAINIKQWDTTVQPADRSNAASKETQ